MEPQTQFLFSETFTESDWLEAVSLFSPAQFSVGKSRAVATLTAYVETFDKLKSCVHFLRGYAWVGASKELRRVRPARHPYWPNLVCTEILEVTGLEFDRKQEIFGDMDLPYAKYHKFKIVASFTAPPYLIYEDWEVDTEDERWTTFTPKPYVDFFDLPAGVLYFVADNPLKGWNGMPIAGPQTIIRSQKSLYELKWYEVPISFVRDADGALPKIDAAVGKISSDSYAGKPAGCWLLDEADVEIYNDPIVGDILGTPGRHANVTLRMKLWDPPRGHATITTRGWRLELAQDGLAYPTNRAAGTTAKYEAVEFASLFRHHSLP